MKYIKKFENFNLDGLDYDNLVILIRDLYENKVYEWKIDDILEEINRDHSDEWTDYDRSDWLEGWNEWAEGDAYSLLDENGNQLNDFLKVLDSVRDFNV